MTLGDVLAVVSGLLGLVATWTAVLLATAFLFPSVTARAYQQAQSRPWLCFFIGVAVCLTLGLASVFLLALPNPGAKLAGWVLFGLLWTRLLVGGAGIAQLMGDRIRDRSPNVSPFAGLAYGSLILGVALFFPAVGWFFLAPLAGLWSLGVGVMALFRVRRPGPAVAAELPEVPVTIWEEAGAGR
jgi:hypothetical protein